MMGERANVLDRLLRLVPLIHREETGTSLLIWTQSRCWETYPVLPEESHPSLNVDYPSQPQPQGPAYT